MLLLSLKSKPLSVLESIWLNLETKLQPESMTSHWFWVKTWLDSYGDRIPYEFFALRDNGEYHGICLIARETGRFFPFPVKNYYLGTAGEPIKERIMMLDNSILVTPSYKESFVNLLIDTLNQHYSWQELTLQFFNQDDIRIFSKIMEQKQIQVVPCQETSYVYNLAVARAENIPIINTLSSRVRKRIKRSCKELGDGVVSQLAQTVSEAETIFNELVSLHQHTWVKRGKRGMFSSDRCLNFHRQIIQHYIPQKKVLLFRASSQWGTVGCVYLFIHKARAIAYQTGFQDFTTYSHLNSSRIKHGLITHLLCMRACLDLGLDEYDFGPAEYRYKSELTNRELDTWSLSVRRSITPYIRDYLWNVYLKADQHTLTKKLLLPMYAVYKKIS